jgi:hypothetical protein
MVRPQGLSQSSGREGCAEKVPDEEKAVRLEEKSHDHCPYGLLRSILIRKWSLDLFWVMREP